MSTALSSDPSTPGQAASGQPATLRPRPGHRVAPLLKWPGGKSEELPKVVAGMPQRIEKYFEPFVGGGAAFFAMPSDVPAYINDTSADLIAFYRLVQNQDGNLFSDLLGIDDWWDRIARFVDGPGTELVDLFVSGPQRPDQLKVRVSSVVRHHLSRLMDTVTPRWEDLRDHFATHVEDLVPRKLLRMRTIEHQRAQLLPIEDVIRNVEGAVKAACYTTLRAAYNRSNGFDVPARRAGLFFFLREYSYAAMFRFNSHGGFNVPYGGITYNRKDFRAKVEHLRSPGVQSRLATTAIVCDDFESFLERHQPGADDFMFLDPPYDSHFSNYDANAFGVPDHKRLAATMRRVPCRVQLIIKSTPTVLEIYSHSNWHVVAFDKRYMWTIKERNDRGATHLMITNYLPDGLSG